MDLLIAQKPIVQAYVMDDIFEKLEGARYLNCLKKGGRLVVNTQQIDPMPVIIGQTDYPDGILEDVKASGAEVDAIDALEIARQAGSAKAVNIVLMARLAKYFHIPYEKWIAAIEKTVAPKFVDMNKKAFELSYNH